MQFVKNSLIVCSSLITFMVYGQNPSNDCFYKIYQNMNNLGIDSSASLNEYEGHYLDFFFFEERGAFNFSGKRVCFFTGNIGSIRTNKKNYFEDVKEILKTNRSMPMKGYDKLVIFNEEQAKLQCYDAAIITGSKKLIKAKDIVNRLK